jgi:plasmid stabilization system protein ParE
LDQKAAEKYSLKWTAPARDDLDENIEYIAQTNITYAIKILEKIE